MIPAHRLPYMAGGHPIKSLFGFERVHVRAGQTASVALYPTLTHFALTSADGSRVPLAGDYRLSFGVQGGIQGHMQEGGIQGRMREGGVRMGYAEAIVSARE